jgi:RNA polymerase sigma-70 factor (ECF subfamily)
MELVIAIQNGDIFAFEQLVKRYQKGLFAFAFRIVFNAGLAEEIVQDALFKIYGAIDRVDTKKKFSTYLFEITKNTAISALRGKRNTIPLEAIVTASDDEAIYEQLNRKEEQERVRRAIRTLPDKYRHVIALYYFDELSYEEISKTVRLPINTVRTHLYRAKEQLKRKLHYENT